MGLGHMLYLLALFAGCWSAFNYGQKDEKRAAAALFAASFATPIFQTHGFTHAEFGVLFVDASLLIGLGYMMLKSDRYWPMFATGFHFAGISVHFAPIIQRGEISAAAYGGAAVIWAYLILLSLGLGAFIEARERKS